MNNFDQFIGIDWSGSKAVNTKSIAVAFAKQGTEAPKLLSHLRSRTAVSEFIDGLIDTGTRTLIGIDANFGYAYHVGEQHFGANYIAPDQWKSVDEYSRNNQNFYAEGFWSNSKFNNFFWLEGKKPPWFDAEKLRRDTEVQCIKDGYGHPESPFKLCYAKQVGKGGLAAQRMAHNLKQKWQNKIAVWPFENDVDYNDANVVMTEIYPRQFLMRSGYGTKKVKTIEGLNGVYPYFKTSPMSPAENITDHDTDALVSAAGLRYLCGMKSTVPKNLVNPTSLSNKAKKAEGWIFGVGDQV